MNILLIGLGGFLGAVSRHILNEVLIKYISTNFPIGILIVNVLGCLLVGLVLGNSMISKDHLYYFFAVGFLGSFTTMSAFSYQAIELFNTNIFIACSYIILTLMLTILATYIGINFSK